MTLGESSKNCSFFEVAYGCVQVGATALGDVTKKIDFERFPVVSRL